jgi:hypothetical protein
MEHVVVERSFTEPVQPGDVDKTMARRGWCLDAHRVTFVQGFLSADGRRMVCVYEAPDAESVRIANREMGAPFDRVWTAARIAPR